MFGLNILVRKGVTNSSVGTWDPSNAQQLIEYTESKGYKVNWELGNGITCIASVLCSINVCMFAAAALVMCTYTLCDVCLCLLMFA